MKRRILSIIMALALCVSACPTWALAEESVSSPCTHHRSHTPDCGYIEAEPGHECTHEHTEDCYRTAEGEDGNATKELDCHHEHDESCGYREEIEGNPCTFVCEICNEGTERKMRKKTQNSRKMPASASTTRNMMIPAAISRNRRTMRAVRVLMSAVSALLKS